MIRFLLAACLVSLYSAGMFAQTTVLDFETPETSTTFQYFGSPLDGTLSAIIPNPDPSGGNTSATVMAFVKPGVAEVWAGAFSNPNPTYQVDLTSDNKISIKVWMDHIGNLTLKLENSTNGGSNWVQTVANTQVNTWETLIFDPSTPSIEAPNTAAIGFTYATVTLFFDFGTGGTGTDVTSYLDELLTLPSAPPVATTILDFEAPATSTVFQYFGSPLDGTFTDVIENPDKSGLNTSDSVTAYVKPAVAEVWAGCFSNPNPATPVDLVTNNRIAINVWMDHIGNLALKLEGSPDGGDNWIITQPNTKVGEWETLFFDPAIPSLEAPNTAAMGHTYTRVVLFFDFGNGGTGVDVTSYFDDLVTLAPPPAVTTILDFEKPETSTGFQYFGSGLDGTFTQVIANPDPSGINVSGNVTEYIKPAVSEVWAGAFSNPNPATPVTLDAGSELCIKVWMNHIGNLALKLEGGASGQPNWITQVSNTKVNEWEELCFDPAVPSIEAPFEPASGTYSRIVLFFDFGQAGTGTDVTSYFDDIAVKSSGAPQQRTINFRVDMNQYTENFDQVYVSGSFNGWSGDANPLSDPDFDGIWEGSVQVINGAYEYKVTLDNWAAQEQFTGLEECTRRDPSGQYVNRLLLVSGDATLPEFCFNSCYDCGEEVGITFRVGFDNVQPSPDGVWLAGGGNFDVPGGRYQMKDDDADGIYTITVPRYRGFSSFYTFANGNCPDYSCKENIGGLPCAHPENFNDRFLSPVEDDIVIGTCFATCADNAECTTGFASLAPDDGVFILLGNPAGSAGVVLLFGGDFRADRTVYLFNTMGQVVGQWRIDDTRETFALPVSSLASGLYTVTVTSGGRFYSRRLVK